jgi:hypothetical protein
MTNNASMIEILKLVVMQITVDPNETFKYILRDLVKEHFSNEKFVEFFNQHTTSTERLELLNETHGVPDPYELVLLKNSKHALLVLKMDSKEKNGGWAWIYLNSVPFANLNLVCACCPHGEHIQENGLVRDRFAQLMCERDLEYVIGANIVINRMGESCNTHSIEPRLKVSILYAEQQS